MKMFLENETAKMQR